MMEMQAEGGQTHGKTELHPLVQPGTPVGVGTFTGECLAAPPVTPQCRQVPCSPCMWLSRSFPNNLPILSSKAKGGWNLTSVANKSYLVRFNPYPKLLISFGI